jgi:hypothetical protein
MKRPDHVERARVLLKGAGLTLPPVPPALQRGFRERGPWCFSSRRLTRSPYDMKALTEPVRDYVLVAHAGHGVNSYAMHYFLVQRPLRLFLQIGWGGVYMDRRQTTALVNRCVRLAAPLIAATADAQHQGRLDRETWPTVIASDFYGGAWWPPGGETPANGFLQRVRPVKRGAVIVKHDPAAVLRQAIAWCRRRAARRGLVPVIVSEQGGRETLEDRHAVTECAGGLFAAVYDGHGGAALPRS